MIASITRRMSIEAYLEQGESLTMNDDVTSYTAKLFNDKETSDFYVECEGERCYVHTVFLRRNEYFRTLLATQVGGKKDHVSVSRERFLLLRILIKSLYTDKIPMEDVEKDDIDILQLVNTAKEFMISGRPWMNLVYIVGKTWREMVDDNIEVLESLYLILGESLLPQLLTYMEEAIDRLPESAVHWSLVKEINYHKQFALYYRLERFDLIDKEKCFIDTLKKVVMAYPAVTAKHFNNRQISYIMRAQEITQSVPREDRALWVKSMSPFVAHYYISVGEVKLRAQLRGNNTEEVMGFDATSDFTIKDTIKIGDDTVAIRTIYDSCAQEVSEVYECVRYCIDVGKLYPKGTPIFKVIFI